MSWTEGRFKSFIVSGLRGVYRRFPNKYETLKEAFVGKKENVKTKRQAAHYKCASCGEDYPASEVNVDHIDPVVDPVVGFVDWNTFIERLFCGKENLQVLCTECHTKKTNEEKRKNGTRKKSKKE